MSITAVVLEGARRAALYAALLFTFDMGSVAAQPPVQPAASLAIEGSIAESGLTLAAHHVDVHVADDKAQVRTRLLLRNDRARTVSAQYVLPHAARVAHGDAWSLGAADADGLCDDGDLSAVDAEVAEAADPPQRLARQHDVIVVAPGEQVTLEVEHALPVASVDRVRRLVLPLPADRDAPWVPRFSADVYVESEKPIRRLASPTHGALVDGIGERAALLSIDGFVYRQSQLVVEFEVDAPARAVPALALERAPVTAAR